MMMRFRNVYVSKFFFCWARTFELKTRRTHVKKIPTFFRFLYWSTKKREQSSLFFFYIMSDKKMQKKMFRYYFSQGHTQAPRKGWKSRSLFPLELWTETWLLHLWRPRRKRPAFDGTWWWWWKHLQRSIKQMMFALFNYDLDRCCCCCCNGTWLVTWLWFFEIGDVWCLKTN